MDGGTGPLVGNGTESANMSAAVVVPGATGVVGAGPGAVDDEFDEVATVALGVPLIALEVAGAT